MEFRYDDPFMNTGDRTISEMGRFARQYVHSDPTSCIVKQGMIVEYIVTTFLREAGYCSDSGWDMGISEKLQILKDEGYWNEEAICRKMMKPLEEICLWYDRYHSESDSSVREGKTSKKEELQEALWNFNLSHEAKGILDDLDNLAD